MPSHSVNRTDSHEESVNATHITQCGHFGHRLTTLQAAYTPKPPVEDILNPPIALRPQFGHHCWAVDVYKFAD